MDKRNIYPNVVVFFCLIGCVCVGSAIGADETSSADPFGSDTSIFDENAATAAESDPLEIPAGQSVSVGSFGQIDLHVKDLDLTKVLQLLSIQSQRNIVASRNVAGAVSADLYGVDFYDALDAILHTNGFGYREKGNFVYVYTSAELQALEDTERKLTTRVIRLNYITATDVSTFVTPLLSGAGSLAISGEPVAGFTPSTGDGGANSFAYPDTLVIRDYAENVDEIVAVVQELDVRPKQVLIEATILEARLSEDNAFGVDLNVIVDADLTNFISPLNFVDTLAGGKFDIVDPTTGDPIREDVGPFAALGKSGAAQTTVGNTLTGESGIKVGFVSHNVSAFVRALDRVTDTTVVAKPKLLVLNRQRAELLSGRRLGYLSTTQSESSVTQTVEFLEVGTQLSVRPFVSDDGYIRLELKPEISDGDTVAIEGLVIPNETTQTLTTNVIVKDGQTIVMGGLFQEDIAVGRNQVPGLGDIPLIGAAFQGREDTIGRTEVIFLITPTVIADDDLIQAGDRLTDSIEQARIGARQGLLPWSRTKVTAGHMQNALKHYDQGLTSRAKWSVQMALNLDPTRVDAIELKEQLSDWPDRSLHLLGDTIDKVIREKMKASSSNDADDQADGDLAQAADQAPFEAEAAADFVDVVDGQVPDPFDIEGANAADLSELANDESWTDQADPQQPSDTDEIAWPDSESADEQTPELEDGLETIEPATDEWPADAEGSSSIEDPDSNIDWPSEPQEGEEANPFNQGTDATQNSEEAGIEGAGVSEDDWASEATGDENNTGVVDQSTETTAAFDEDEWVEAEAASEQEDWMLEPTLDDTPIRADQAGEMLEIQPSEQLDPSEAIGLTDTGFGSEPDGSSDPFEDTTQADLADTVSDEAMVAVQEDEQTWESDTDSDFWDDDQGELSSNSTAEEDDTVTTLEFSTIQVFRAITQSPLHDDASTALTEAATSQVPTEQSHDDDTQADQP